MHFGCCLPWPFLTGSVLIKMSTLWVPMLERGQCGSPQKRRESRRKQQANIETFLGARQRRGVFDLPLASSRAEKRDQQNLVGNSTLVGLGVKPLHTLVLLLQNPPGNRSD